MLSALVAIYNENTFVETLGKAYSELKENYEGLRMVKNLFDFYKYYTKASRNPEIANKSQI